MAIIDRIDIGGNLFEIKDIAANQFVTKAVSDLLYYYTKDETFTKDEIRALIAQIQGMSIIPVQVLPTASAETMGNIYLVPSSDPETRNLYDEYFTIESGGSYSWEIFGSAAISLDGLVTDEELESALAGKVDKVTGKGLSTNDYTDTDKAKVDGALQSETDPTVPAWAKQPNKPSYTAQEVGALPANTPIPTALSQLSDDSTHRVVTDSEKNLWNETNIIHASVMSFPTAFNNYTLEQMLSAFGITNEQFFRINGSAGVYSTLLAASVYAFYHGVFITNWGADGITFRRLSYDSVSGTYSFSGNLYISNEQADWNEADSNDPAYIKNKPTIPAGVVVDQVYDGTSANAQSGVAMAGALAGKQDAISDLSDIRSGAALGATAVQPEAGKGLFSGNYNDLSNKPTIPDAQIQSDWNQSDNTAKDYIKNKPSIPAAQVNSDWNANSGVAQILNKPSIPDAVEANPTVPSGTTPSDLTGLKVGDSYYGIPQPTVDNTPTKNSTNLVKSGGVYDEVHPAVASAQPSGGFAPNVVYDLGTLTGSVTFALASPTDNAIPNAYHWTFDTGSTAPTITWPNGVIWPDGVTPTIEAGKHYEILVRNGYGSILVFTIPSA